MTTHRWWISILLFASLWAIAGCGRQVESDRASAVDPAGKLPSGSDERRANTEVPDQPLQRAVQWLWKQQAADGGWHSENYAVLRSGQSFTPYVLHLLLTVPERDAPRPTEATQRALDFIRTRLNEDGVLGYHDPDVLEYPNYSTAYALRCLVLAGEPRDRTRILKMRAWLVQQQFDDAAGFSPSDPAYGAWGFGGQRKPGSPGHVDLAHTRYVLQALRESGRAGFGNDGDEAVFQRAQTFLRLLQRHPDEVRQQPIPGDLKTGGPAPYDGGFYFSPVVLAANKAGLAPADESASPYFRSYATATTDGAMALLMAGATADDPRVRDSVRWLTDHPRLSRPEGIPEDESASWGEALHFYHLAVRGELCAALDWPGTWRVELKELLAAEQQTDGSFRNSRSSLMKEDDPILATTLAAVALRSAADK